MECFLERVYHTFVKVQYLRRLLFFQYLTRLARLPRLEHWLQMHEKMVIFLLRQGFRHSTRCQPMFVYIRMNEILRNITLKQL